MWTSLEIAKLVVQGASPVAVAILGLYLTRLAKRFEDVQWRNQRLIEKRIEVYDNLASDLNDLLCYFTFVGCWKDLTPPQVVELKRRVDKKIHLAAPLFSPAFFEQCTAFINLCYATFQGWGQDAKLRTTFERRREAAGSRWEIAWDSCFSKEISEPTQVLAAYRAIMQTFSNEIGILNRP